MIHSVHTLSIRQYAIIDKTNDIKLLRRWWNIFPVGWFDVDPFFDSFRELFNASTNPAVKESYRLLSYNNIIMLDAMLKTMSILMRNTNDRSLFTLIFKSKSKAYKGNFDFYVNKIERITGIKIVDGNDLKNLKSEIERLWDKYQERFKVETDDQPKNTFLEDAMVIFTIMDMAFIPDMKLSELAALKELADKKIKQMNDKNNG